MSNNDKTKQKLMESMRMTKAGSDNKTEEADASQDLISEDNKAVKKETKNATTKKAAKDAKKVSVDPYQSVRRVWPD